MMTNPTFPWPMDKPIEEMDYDFVRHAFKTDDDVDLVNYLLHRLKLAEGDRDRLVMKVQAAFYEGSSGVWEDDFDNWQLNYDIDTMD